jgi:hypothetical protein
MPARPRVELIGGRYDGWRGRVAPGFDGMHVTDAEGNHVHYLYKPTGTKFSGRKVYIFRERIVIEGAAK